ncbi:MAG: Ig-like domain-containing protein [Lachnospiraceae bacterium]|jgi:uncharacterized protein YjdB|nr:Ig-like domain-containing protein [Lachnospiraceae bacterium]
MKKLSKRLLGLTLALVMSLSLLPANVMPAVYAVDVGEDVQRNEVSHSVPPAEGDTADDGSVGADVIRPPVEDGEDPLADTPTDNTDPTDPPDDGDTADDGSVGADVIRPPVEDDEDLLAAPADTSKFIAPIGPLAEGSIPISTREQLEALADYKPFPLEDEEYPTGDFTRILWSPDTGSGGGSWAPALDNSASESGAALALATSDYAASAWNPTPAAPATVLQSAVLPGAAPQLVQAGKDLLMIFQSESGDAEREPGDSTVLLYSVFEGGSWSAPQAVWDNGAADYKANPYVYGNQLYLVWQKAKAKSEKTDPTALYEEIMANSEIAFAVWDAAKGAFTGQQFLTDNETPDLQPVLTADGSRLTLVWQQRDSAALTRAVNSLMARTHDGAAWQAPAKLTQPDGQVMETAAAYENGQLNVAYSTYADEEFGLRLLAGGTAKTLAANGAIPIGLKYNNSRFYWSENGIVKEYYIPSGTAAAITAGGERAIPGSYLLAGSGSRRALVWSETTPEGGYRLAASYQSAKGWGSPVTLYESESGAVQALDGLMLADGGFALVANTVSGDAHDLTYYQLAPATDLALDFAYAESGQDAESGLQPVHYGATNAGDTAINSFNLKISAGGKIYLDENIDCELAPGDSAVFSEFIDISGLAGETDFTATVAAAGDADAANNSATFPLGFADITLTLSAYDLPDMHILEAVMENASPLASDVVLEIRKDSATGELVDSLIVPALSQDDSYVYQFAVEKEGLPEAGQTYHVAAVTEKSDSNEFNNSALIVLYPDPADAGEEEPTEEVALVPATGLSITSAKALTLTLGGESVLATATVAPAEASNQGIEWSSADIWVATVDNNGLIAPMGIGATTITAASSDGGFNGVITVTVVTDEELSLIVSAGAGGRVQYTDAAPYHSGDAVKLLAVPEGWYSFDGWYEGEELASSEAAYSFEMTGSRTLAARFRPLPPRLAKAEIHLDKTYLLLQQGETSQLKAYDSRTLQTAVAPAWKSDKPSVATVDENGVVRAVGSGTAVISAYSEEYKIVAECRVDVFAATAEKPNLRDAIEDVHLLQSAVTANVLSTNYTKVPIQLALEQNKPNIQSAPGLGGATGLVPYSIDSVALTNEELAGYFTPRVVDDRTIELVPTAAAKDFNARNGKAASLTTGLLVTVDGKPFTATSELTVKMTRTAPTAKAAALKFNSFFPGAALKVAVSSTLGKVTDIALRNEGDAAKVSFDRASGMIKLQNKDSKPKKLAFDVTVEGFADPIKVNVSASVANKKPVVKLSAKSVTMRKNAALQISGPGITSLTVDNNSQYSVTKLDTQGNFILSYTGNGNVPKKASLKLKVGFAGTTNTVVVPLTVNKPPLFGSEKVSLSAKTVTLNKWLADDRATIKIAMNPVDAAVPEISGDDAALAALNWQLKGNVLEVSLDKEQAMAGQGYKLKIGNAALTVKAVDSAPKITVKAKGTLNVLDPASTVTLTPKFANYRYSGGAPTLDPASDAVFKIVGISTSGAVTLQMKDGEDKPIGTHKVTLTYTDGSASFSNERAVNVATKRLKPTLSQSVKQIELQRNDKYSEGRVDIAVKKPAAAQIARVEIKGEEHNGLYRIRPIQDGSLAIGFASEQAAFDAGDGASIALNVYLAGSNTPVTVTVKVVVR